MLILEKRPEPSRAMVTLAPVIAIVLTVLSASIIVTLLGRDPLVTMRVFFLDPLSDVTGWAELILKAIPLALCAVGLAFGFRAQVWNIGAEGQLTIGALAGAALALAFYEVDTPLLLPAILLTGVAGGMAWGAIPAFLRTRYNANEILTSLMLTYVAILLLAWLIHGPMKDPDGFNFPESRLFHDAALLPVLIGGTRLHYGVFLALAAVITAWVMLGKHIIGFQIQASGLAPRAAEFAGFRANHIVWISFLVAGGASGLAGIIEVTGPLGQVVPSLSPGYGFTAIIVAFLGRLHALGILLAALLMALTYIGGEAAQIMMNLPSAITNVFQGMLLLYLLSADLLIHYRIRNKRRQG
ncbi:MAG: ABC transporter permease [Pseudomonadota bacterium]